jgi:hypothetical protein
MQEPASQKQGQDAKIESPAGEWISALQARGYELYGGMGDIPGLLGDEGLVGKAMERAEQKGYSKLPDLTEPNPDKLRSNLALASYYLAHLNRERNILPHLYNPDGQALNGDRFALAQTDTHSPGDQTIGVMVDRGNKFGRSLSARWENVPGHTDGKKGWVLYEDVVSFGHDLLAPKERQE